MLTNIVIIGASGAIGSAFTKQLARNNTEAMIHAFSRKTLSIQETNIIPHVIDYDDEANLDKVTPEDSGLCFAWDGQEIKP